MAGGSGTRMGASEPKQFLKLKGKAILHWTIQRIVNAVPDVKIITVLPADYINTWKQYCINNNFYCPQTIVAGGITRFHSVRNGLEKVPDGALVGIHDGVRPLVSEALIRELYHRAESRRAVIPITPCTDTMKAVCVKEGSDGVKYYETIEGINFDRSIMFGAQTPQVFHSEVLKKAYTQAFDTSFTDDASVAAADGVVISYIEGERLNLKITTPDDLKIANLFV